MRAMRVRRGLSTVVALGCMAVLASSCGASTTPPPSPLAVTWMQGFAAPGTPARYNKVGVIKVGPSSAKNVLVLEPGTSAGSAYFVPLAKWIVSKTSGWQVWSVERRENLLEDQSELNLFKEHKATATQLFDYYLGYLKNPGITQHFQLIPNSSVEFAKQWGMNVAVEDLHVVIDAAKKLGGSVVLGGHSLGGSVVTAYATWDFSGRAGADALAGLVYIDGGSAPTPVSTQEATQELQSLDVPKNSPWLEFGGIAAPYAGIFNATGSAAALLDPNGPSLGQSSGLLPADIVPPVRVTNLGQYGYALNAATSPSSLLAAQAHLGAGITASGSVHGWDSTGRSHSDRALRDDVLGVSDDERRRHGVVLPSASHRRYRSSGQRKRKSGTKRARRRRDHGARPSQEPADLCLRGAPGRSGCSRGRHASWPGSHTSLRAT